MSAHCAGGEWRADDVTPRFYSKRKVKNFDFHMTLLTHQSNKLVAKYNFFFKNDTSKLTK
jgi:hypothetical protein